jgi:hypothetical protein
MTTANIEISPKVIAERFKRYFKIEVTIIEYVITQFNYHYTVYFKEPLPGKYMETLETWQYGFLQTKDGGLYIHSKKLDNLEYCITKHHHPMVTGEMFYQTMEGTSYKHNGEKYEPMKIHFYKDSMYVFIRFTIFLNICFTAGSSNEDSSGKSKLNSIDRL